ncbi:MAG: methyltransferase domain-containing protein [Planctomycetia bacterium]|nr:methyltransferase domain-containing protein [Planctomycetia bacterium]
MSWLSKYLRERKRRKLEENVLSILSDTTPWDTRRAEKDFDRLQNFYPPFDSGYLYDEYSIWERCIYRSLTLLKIPGMEQTGKRVLELGCGEGFTGTLLHCYGHSVYLNDQRDRRLEKCQHLPFIQVDICDPEKTATIPGELDLIFSYNAMEHFPNPLQVFQNIVPKLKKKGHIYLHFNPLYGAPRGLHAYSIMNMPYPQFLFSEEFIFQKMKEIETTLFGEKSGQLQYVNRWLYHQYEELWKYPGLPVVFIHRHTDFSSLEVVLQYPECFRGRGLTWEDITTSGYEVLLRKE